MTEVIGADDRAAARQRGAEALRSGGLVVAPSDTVYAVLADAFVMEATERLFQARGADRSAPLPVLVRSPRQLAGLVSEVGEPAERLMAAFWPGPLTLVFAAGAGLAWDLGETRGTVAVRMPAEELLHELVAEIGPLACTAASRVGEPPARTIAEARAALGDEVVLYIDGGQRAGVVSTIVDVSRGGAEVLRAGALSADDVFAAVTGTVGWGRPTGRSAPEPADEEAAGPGGD